MHRGRSVQPRIAPRADLSEDATATMNPSSVAPLVRVAVLSQITIAIIIITMTMITRITIIIIITKSM